MTKSNDSKSKPGHDGGASRNQCGSGLPDHGANAGPQEQFRKLLADLIAQRILAERLQRRADRGG